MDNNCSPNSFAAKIKHTSQSKTLVRLQAHENGNTFWIDRQKLIACKWLDQMLTLSEPPESTTSDQAIVISTATSTTLFQFIQLLNQLYHYNNQVAQISTSQEPESRSSFLISLLHYISWNNSPTSAQTIPKDSTQKQDFTETVHQRWKIATRKPLQHELIDIIKTADLLDCEPIFKTALAWYEKQFMLHCNEDLWSETHAKKTNGILDYHLRHNFLNHTLPNPANLEKPKPLRSFLKERTAFENKGRAARMFSAHSSYVLIHKNDTTLQLWCPKTATLLNEFVEVKKFALSTNEQILALESCNELAIWNTQRNRCVTMIPLPWEKISQLFLNDNGSLLIIGNENEEIAEVWDLANKQCIKTIQTHQREFKAFTLNYSICKTYDCPASTLAYISKKDPTKIKLFDCINHTCTSIQTSASNNMGIYDFRLSLNNHLAIFSTQLGSYEKTYLLEVWDYKENRKIFDKQYKTKPKNPAFFTDDAEILVYFEDNERSYFDITKIAHLQHLSPTRHAAQCYHRWYTSSTIAKNVCSSDGLYFFNYMNLIRNYKKDLSLEQLALIIRILEGKELCFTLANRIVGNKLYISLPNYFKKQFHKQIKTIALPLGTSSKRIKATNRFTELEKITTYE